MWFYTETSRHLSYSSIKLIQSNWPIQTHLARIPGYMITENEKKSLKIGPFTIILSICELWLCESALLSSIFWVVYRAGMENLLAGRSFTPANFFTTTVVFLVIDFQMKLLIDPSWRKFLQDLSVRSMPSHMYVLLWMNKSYEKGTPCWDWMRRRGRKSVDNQSSWSTRAEFGSC